MRKKQKPKKVDKEIMKKTPKKVNMWMKNKKRKSLKKKNHLQISFTPQNTSWERKSSKEKPCTS